MCYIILNREWFMAVGDYPFNTLVFCFHPSRCLGKEASVNDQRFRGDGVKFKCKVGTSINLCTF